MTTPRLHILATAAMVLLMLLPLCPGSAEAQRRVTPVTPASPMRAPVDSALIRQRALEARRARSTQYTDDQGKTVMVDTVTGTEWVDSTMLPKKPKMLYPKIYAVSVGLNIWDPVMRIFGQDYGIGGVDVRLNMYNRYIPAVEIGLGQARHNADEYGYTYRSPLAPYAKLGIDYNFLFNSNPAYQLYGGLRYGFASFKYEVTGATDPGTYWGDKTTFDIPSQSASAGWLEVVLGLRVRLWGNISAGWALRYHTILHQSHPVGGDPWYIPGYGTASSPLSGSITISYTIPLGHKRSAKVDKSMEDNGPDIPAPDGAEPSEAPANQAQPTTDSKGPQQ